MSIKQLSKTFIIRVYDNPEVRKSRLVGIRAFFELVSDERLAQRIVERAYKCRDHKSIHKLRRGVEIHFVNH